MRTHDTAEHKHRSNIIHIYCASKLILLLFIHDLLPSRVFPHVLSYILKFRPGVWVLVPALLGHLPYPRQVNAVKYVTQFGSIIRNGTFTHFIYDFYIKNTFT